MSKIVLLGMDESDYNNGRDNDRLHILDSFYNYLVVNDFYDFNLGAGSHH